MENLTSLFRRLALPDCGATHGEAFSSRSVPGHDEWRVAKSEVGLPAILVAVGAGLDCSRTPTVRLENLRVEHNVRCSLTRSDGGVEVARHSIIQCLSDDSDVQDCFLRTVDGALAGVKALVSAEDLVDLIDRLVTLFRLIRQPRSQVVHGLWAELFIILSASDPSMMIDAWHCQPSEHFDFSREAERLEVKSSATRSREHVFSFEQVYPPSGASVLVASVHVEAQTNGTTLGDLWDAVMDAAPSADSRLKVERVCVESLGRDLAAGRAFSGDWNLGMDSLSFYRMTDIPRPAPDCPPGVSQLRFCSDVSLAAPVEPACLGSFHRCCLGLVVPP